MATSMHVAAHARAIAKSVQAFQRGETPDNTLIPVCLVCDNPQKPDQCATTDWKGMLDPVSGQRFPSHREFCPVYKKSVLKKATIQAISAQFPWTRPQKDGTISHTIFEAASGLHGSGRAFGWWTRKPCCADSSRYVHGFALLEEDHLNDEEGWLLPADQIPWLDFSSRLAVPPRGPPPVEHGWSQYYAWRGLPMESPAVLLLHWPLSVYRMLHVLGFTQVPPSGTRRRLTVHLLGLDRELDFLPVFGELALLLPNIDLDLILFGNGVAKLTQKAAAHPSSLASRPFVYTYKAPKALGAGTLRIELSCGPAFYDGTDLTPLRREPPHALLAFNAGISDDREWWSMVFASRALEIPFAVTDRGELRLATDISWFLRRMPALHMAWWPEARLTPVERARILAMGRVEYPVEMNPYMYPGPKSVAVQEGPVSDNAFTLIITPKTTGTSGR
ncbi:hypothetical protein H0H81_002242 [Sphagnurus paluster]|uniref:Mitochondrial splicing suppressor 51-like C-terminal domain-containing protein n=1 Tax=Sphagnurus paluster TaxID=117069 RepID=A0A9P7K2L2_9AGAR|nr:hypothetical protein H0H81_002242 [Sphagnurus paluster]